MDMPRQDVKTNEKGRRIGESHPRAVLSDHEVDLLHDLLAEREAIVARMLFDGLGQGEIDVELARAGLSYRCLAVKLEIAKDTVRKIAKGLRRCQTPEA